MFESAFEEILAKCGCFPSFHSPYFNDHKIFNYTLLQKMPFIKQNISLFKGCMGSSLLCSSQILKRISDYQSVFDPFQLRHKRCMESCNDQIHQVQTTTSNFPAKPVF